MVKLMEAELLRLTKREVRAIRHAKTFCRAYELADATKLNLMTIYWIWNTTE